MTVSIAPKVTADYCRAGSFYDDASPRNHQQTRIESVKYNYLPESFASRHPHIYGESYGMIGGLAQGLSQGVLEAMQIHQWGSVCKSSQKCSPKRASKIETTLAQSFTCERFMYRFDSF
ncbi:unnamed protein product [Fusarium graminearum]|uniref:Chromosome 1, complete genome n=1 Tax=Gibberella zeae (strain ATCC MYA-4620 / CBS 123657 / FGSC 9075 / NRRL 31084 / PH-1) TaxID=229533 RepID=I1S4N9_GIBZE|nr:hypothetical protein FGSG_11807 [Fusarium graminearum PH-1]ESU05894.1 hypothetical protein FGSG_11807 [Fusarium graminearum PH-1]CEF72658.1 unnamed protein product [Fusarium graminearum]CZS75923.1 unnamed protein product [Fusarium graminearum]|eukprot:XP_011316379.1 hypothetical protein FGSG_11807 [Fusarium graminearum PH-1]